MPSNHLFSEFTSLTVEETVEKLDTSKNNGLTNQLAHDRLLKYGKNEILKDQKNNLLQIFGRQFKSLFIYLLIAAAITSLLLKEIIDALMIVLFVLINAGLGFYQEYHAEKTLKLCSFKLFWVKTGRDFWFCIDPVILSIKTPSQQ